MRPPVIPQPKPVASIASPAPSSTTPRPTKCTCNDGATSRYLSTPQGFIRVCWICNLPVD
jgi:hypothetical protein